MHSSCIEEACYTISDDGPELHQGSVRPSDGLYFVASEDRVESFLVRVATSPSSSPSSLLKNLSFQTM